MSPRHSGTSLAVPVVGAVEVLADDARQADALGLADAEVGVAANVDLAAGLVLGVGDAQGVDVELDAARVDVHALAVAQLVVVGAFAVPLDLVVDLENTAADEGVTRNARSSSAGGILSVGSSSREVARAAHDLGAEEGCGKADDGDNVGVHSGGSV
ncbi:hypothetical protein F5Y02DRAFT_391177 [Annulohypoxylon stygium]|nr:hypothetical protein F5Y02DRAFT_391177 [Annulohypoxylon stygium]